MEDVATRKLIERHWIIVPLVLVSISQAHQIGRICALPMMMPLLFDFVIRSGVEHSEDVEEVGLGINLVEALAPFGGVPV